jgi:hypothetical protein
MRIRKYGHFLGITTAAFLAFGLTACSSEPDADTEGVEHADDDAHSTATIQPHLAFTIGAESGLTAPRDLTVDEAGNVFVFDYDDYVIHKFDPSGGSVATFGGPEGEDAGFAHLMAIRVLGDSLLALDAGSVSVFDLSGQSRGRRILADTIICDLPRLHPSGQWAGEWIIEATAEKALTLRGAEGLEQSRVAAYALAEFFPGVEPGGMFFIGPTQARSYVYDFLPDGRLVWAVSDEARVHVRHDDRDDPIYSAAWPALPFPPEEVQAMRERQAELSPPLFMNVPEEYQRIQHLLVDETGEIWLYVLSLDRAGFLRISASGEEIGFHAVDADFDLTTARVTATEGRLYFLVGGGEETRIYVADRP